MMDNGQYVNQIIFHRIKDTIWKSRQKGASNPWNDFCIQKWSFFKTFELQLKNRLKFSAQPTPLFFIPTERFANFANCASRNFKR